MVHGCAWIMRTWLAVLFAAQTLAFTSPHFQRDIRPILAGHCFKCHGPDEKTRKADLRLDIRPEEDALARLAKRIDHPDSDELMPPPSAKKPLSAVQKQVLKEWVQDGGGYTQHWAFIPPKAEPLPQVKQDDWPRNNIDHFILAQLEAAGKTPSTEADPYRLIRRLSLDLIGLPPTPEEIREFVEDKRPDAYERLTDRLLERPEYGEHWALSWLDLARYADTNGYEKDRPRSIWPWRDWVISAINNDMPFDQFTIEQIAGDMLPGAKQSQRVATGFHRNTMVNEEGGIDPLEFRFYAMVDRVNTTGTTWLGLTLGCAQCHTHKFDPVPHRSYYELMAFMNNTAEPELPLFTLEQAEKKKSFEKKIREQLWELPVDTAKYEAWLKNERTTAVPWQTIVPAKMKTSIGWLEQLEDQSIFASGDTRKHDVYELEFNDFPENITSLRLEALPDESLPNGGPGRAYYEGPKGDFFLSELKLIADGKPVEIASGSVNYAKQWIGSGKPGAMATLDGDLQTGWSASGREGRPSQAVWYFTKPLKAKSLKLQMDFSRHYSASLGRFRLSVAKRNKEPKAKELPGEIEARLAKRAEELKQADYDMLRAYYIETAGDAAELRKPIETLRQGIPKPPYTLVMQERPANRVRKMHRHHRGEFLSPRETVQPKVLPFLPPLDERMPRNRLGFARWLVDPANPLTARVTINRLWASIFGEGIVRTIEDFGYTGAAPTNPELLDWLALELIRQGWSQKKLLRLIVTSATYRQRSGMEYRMSAEQIRDSILTVSGLLHQRIGGASVFPPQTGSIGEGIYGGGGWKTSSGANRYRRSLYTYRKRSMPYAMHDTFDAPSHETCVARREISNTPLQALMLLNDPLAIEASRALAQWAAQQPGDRSAIVKALFERCLSRPPDAEEQKMVLDYFEKTLHRFESREIDATKVFGTGAGETNKRGAWTALSRALLNTHEFITRN
ncbi:MAG: PSD1 and planctomycete cytochrome C domain-containing protein [Verrucomicrobiota bacterium]|nr:PSD1 and planctomycete cytochrome C domain-containing protein [Verrucomicrobiota bacterium]